MKKAKIIIKQIGELLIFFLVSVQLILGCLQNKEKMLDTNGYLIPDDIDPNDDSLPNYWT
jgi:hypothetical protein